MLEAKGGALGVLLDVVLVVRGRRREREQPS
jgi:hypothetical protein